MPKLEASRKPSTVKDEVPEGRLAKKRRMTRAKLLMAAYEVMSQVGVDAAKIKDFTDRADVGFGTFYNYFDTKDALANELLDCLINDMGRRNRLATSRYQSHEPELTGPISTRLVLRTAMASPIWHYWALRPDLLFDRMHRGFGPFAIDDVRKSIARGESALTLEEVPSAWALAVWVMVGGIHDVVVGERTAESESSVCEGVMRILGSSFDAARRISSTALPDYPPPDIDWDFSLDKLIVNHI